MQPRRLLQILLLVVMALFLAEMFTPLHVASCNSVIGKKDEKIGDISAVGHLDDNAPVAFQIHGGDNVFMQSLRGHFKEELAKKMPGATLVDGPPPKNSVSLLMTLKAADERWTPFYSHEALGIHTTIQLPGAARGMQIVADTDLDAVCTGLVARSHFQGHEDTTAPLGAWLVDELLSARKTK
jgi:hypothetical protein